MGAGLTHAGETVADLTREYGLSKSTVFMWDKQYANSGKFTVKDNLTEEEKELRSLLKIEHTHSKRAICINLQMAHFNLEWMNLSPPTKASCTTRRALALCPRTSSFPPWRYPS